MFPHALDPTVALDENARQFTVTNQKYILLDEGGTLEELHRVTIEGIEIPLTETRMLSKQDPGKEIELVPHEFPMLNVQDVDGIGRCLLRGMLSNNGEWQIGAKVVVTGVWSDAPNETFVSNLDVHKVLSEKDSEITAKGEELNKSIEDNLAKDQEIADLKAKLAEAEAKVPVAPVATDEAPAAAAKPRGKKDF